jgi:hypothetical protein
MYFPMYHLIALAKRMGENTDQSQNERVHLG